METLVEYLTYVKGLGYILAVAFLIAFIAFWLMVHTNNKDIIKSVPVVVVIWLTFGMASAIVQNAHSTNSNNVAVTEHIVSEPAVEPVFPEYYSNGSPATITAHRPEKWLGVNTSEYLSVAYGSTANFHKIMGNKVSCQTCHHNSGDEIHGCKDCHGAPFNPDNMNKPGFKAAVHERCMTCHTEVFGGTEGCKQCHTMGPPETVEVAPSRPHQLTWEDCTRCHTKIPGGQEIKIVYHDFCIKCHTKGIADAAKLPSDHAGRTSDTCKGCHKPTGGLT